MKATTRENNKLKSQLSTNSTNIHPNIIKKIFLRLNREGILSQRINRKHEDFDWIASYYIIR